MNTVTGAFSFSGRRVAARLLEMGEPVQTLTRRPDHADPFGGRVAVRELRFDHQYLVESLRGTETVYNTYWIRYSRGGITYDSAVRNIEALVHAARDAGVRRFVHVSIANAEQGSELPYYQGKLAAEAAIKSSGLSYGIVRPAVLFDDQDILLNNVTWLIRRFPFFAVPGDGQYGIQPIHVNDEAELLVRVGHETENITVDAAGPEKFTFDDLLKTIGSAVGRRVRIWHTPPSVALAFTKPVNMIAGDTLLERWEIDGLMAGILESKEPPQGRVKFSEWVREHASTYGRKYHSEVVRHFKDPAAAGRGAPR
jgi:NADH dehydrogenase